MHPLLFCARHAPVLWCAAILLGCFLADWLTGHI